MPMPDLNEELEITVTITVGQRWDSTASKGEYRLTLQHESSLQYVNPEAFLPFTTEVLKRAIEHRLERWKEKPDAD